MKRCLLLAVACCALASAAPGQDQPATSKQPVTSQPSTRPTSQPAVKVSALRVIEVRHVSLNRRRGGAQFPETSEPGPGLHVRLELNGGVIRDLVAWRADLRGRDDRERKVLIDPGGPTPTEAFADLDRNRPGHPRGNRAWLDLQLTPASRDATAVDLEGALTLQLAQTERVVFRNLKLNKGPLQHKQFERLGVSVVRGEMSEDRIRLFIEGETSLVRGVAVTTRDGQNLVSDQQRVTRDSGPVLIQLDLSGSPKGGRLRFDLQKGTRELRVPVKLDKVPLP